MVKLVSCSDYFSLGTRLGLGEEDFHQVPSFLSEQWFVMGGK